MSAPLRLTWFLLTSSVLFAQPPADRSAFIENWSRDIDALVAGLSARGTTVDLSRGISSRGQKDFDKLYPAPAFPNAIASLKASLPRATDAEVVLQLMRIVASAGVAHNSVAIPKGMGFEQRLPLVITEYADSWSIVAAPRAHTALLGARILKLGTLTPAEAVDAVAPFVPHESKVWLRLRAPEYLSLKPVLAHLRLLDAEGRLPLTLQPQAGDAITVSVPLSSSEEPLLGFRDALGISPPLYRHNLERLYWHKYLPEHEAVFIQYRACANDRALSFAGFTSALMKELDAKPVRRVILDLRWNGGGDSRIIRPLKNEIARRLSRGWKLYVLIGPATFSSALDNAIELKRELHATLVGEATGGKPAGYGEVKRLTLPRSGLVIRFTSKLFSTGGAFTGESLVPDLPVPFTFAEQLKGRDPTLQAALAAQ